MAAVVLGLMWKRWLPGHRLQLYLIVYSAYRFLTEFVRPEPAWWLGLTFYQSAASALGAGLTVQWVVEEVRRATGRLSPVGGTGVQQPAD